MDKMVVRYMVLMCLETPKFYKDSEKNLQEFSMTLCRVKEFL